LSKFVSIEKGLGPDGRIAVVRFDRGDGINALSPEAPAGAHQAGRDHGGRADFREGSL